MDGIEIKEKKPGVEEFIGFRRDAGWQLPEADGVAEAIGNSSYMVCAETDGRIVGIGRVIGDGALYFYVQDVIVLGEYQRKGIGTKIMDAIMGYIDKNALPGSYIGLFSARGLEEFYSRYGFIERPCGHLGPGMAFFKK